MPQEEEELILVEDLEDWPCRWDYEFGRSFMRRKTGWATFAVVLLAAGLCEGWAYKRTIVERLAARHARAQ